jgi:hypothetical protein
VDWEIRGLTRLCPCPLQSPVDVLASFPELVHALAQAPRQVGQLFRPKQDEHYKQNDEKIRAAQIPNPNCKNIHY